MTCAALEKLILFMKEARDDFILSRNAKRPTNIDYVIRNYK